MYSNIILFLIIFTTSISHVRANNNSFPQWQDLECEVKLGIYQALEQDRMSTDAIGQDLGLSRLR